MKILGLSRLVPGASQDKVKATLVPEARRGWELYKAGVFREMYTRQDRPGAVVVLECDSLDAARDVIGTLPLVQEGLIEFDLIPLGYFRSFELLIEQ